MIRRPAAGFRAPELLQKRDNGIVPDMAAAMRKPVSFSYSRAFDRTLGWLTEAEQQALRGKRVAIAGLGGVGGVHLLTLVRMGVGAFHIADLDRFELANFNRQVGANLHTIGRAKVEVLAEMASGINPELRIERFAGGVTIDNIDAFLDGVDLFVDGLDFFVIDIRRRVFARCHELGIPAITAAPIGMGVGFLAIMPRGMSFERYFRLGGQTENEQYLRFLMGMAPRGLHRAYLMDPSRVDLASRRGPSTVAACELCAGVAAVAAVKILLRRGNLRPAPYHHHFDPYRGRLAMSWLPFGNAGPVQQLKLALARRFMAAMSRQASVRKPAFPPRRPIEEILDVARWAPSGDNEQPWRFQILDDDTVVVHLSRQQDGNIYEYREGQPTLLAGGMLLESMRIAASAWGRRMDWRYEEGGASHTIVARFTHADDVPVDPLYSDITMRSVDRRPFRWRKLTQVEKSALEGALGDRLRIVWYERRGERWRFARLGAMATDIRLRAPEAFGVHQRAIDWTRDLSPTGIPARAIGVDRTTRVLMRWAMRRWSRMRLLNRLVGTLAAAAQMDYAPGLASAAFFTIAASGDPSPPEQRVVALLRAGQDIQRFWLTASHLNLALQPGFATLIFAYYGETSALFTADPALCQKAQRLAAAFRRTLGAGTEDFRFIGRIGEPRGSRAFCRSTRLPLDGLLPARPDGAGDAA
jgi:nitroreductase